MTFLPAYLLFVFAFCLLKTALFVEASAYKKSEFKEFLNAPINDQVRFQEKFLGFVEKRCPFAMAALIHKLTSEENFPQIVKAISETSSRKTFGLLVSLLVHYVKDDNIGAIAHIIKDTVDKKKDRIVGSVFDWNDFMQITRTIVNKKRLGSKLAIAYLPEQLGDHSTTLLDRYLLWGSKKHITQDEMKIVKGALLKKPDHFFMSLIGMRPTEHAEMIKSILTSVVVREEDASGWQALFLCTEFEPKVLLGHLKDSKSALDHHNHTMATLVSITEHPWQTLEISRDEQNAILFSMLTAKALKKPGLIFTDLQLKHFREALEVKDQSKLTIKDSQMVEGTQAQITQSLSFGYFLLRRDLRWDCVLAFLWTIPVNFKTVTFIEEVIFRLGRESECDEVVRTDLNVEHPLFHVALYVKGIDFLHDTKNEQEHERKAKIIGFKTHPKDGVDDLDILFTLGARVLHHLMLQEAPFSSIEQYLLPPETLSPETPSAKPASRDLSSPLEDLKELLRLVNSLIDISTVPILHVLGTLLIYVEIILDFPEFSTTVKSIVDADALLQ